METKRFQKSQLFKAAGRYAQLENTKQLMRLYKYFSATQRTVDSLKNFRFYFSKFNELNDPCELSILGCTKEQINLIRFKFLEPNGANGIFCLCEKWDNLHMWTQYADGHKGIVVEFETDDDKDFFKELDRVNYTVTPPKFAESMKVKEVIYNKSLDSEKELEWRVFGNNELRQINPLAVKAIIFGYRFPRACSVTTNPSCEMFEMFPKEKVEAFIELDKLFWNNLMPDMVEYYHTIVEHDTYNLKLSPKFDKPKKEIT